MMDHANIGDTEDLATLSKLDEQILLGEISARFFKNKIYTYIGDILVAVNPFKDIGIYGQDVSTKYKLRKRGEAPPHIFAVSDATYQAMQGLRGAAPRNQCILISGESGAGKTESTKLIIKQLVEICKGNTQLEQQILQVNPLLEAFGNAQTLMNDNSSRFGKYIQLKFHNGQVLGAKISEYLLEKSRVARQAEGEENFHVFYYLFAGLSAEEQQKLKLKEPSKYNYLCDGGRCLRSSASKLKESYEELLNAMDMVGFSDQEQDSMFTILAGVLSLGNVGIGENDDGDATIQNKDTHIAASLLGFDARELQDVLTCSITVTKGDEIRRNYTKAQAEDCRDAVAKVLYGRLFSWIVNKVNRLLVPREIVDNEEVQEIGILDIFGFEHFQTNSFEQACINLANEQLQYFFNRHVFTLEQEEYIREGVDWNEIKFVDNQPLLDLFMARPIGLLGLLDEESQFPKGTDQSFVDKMNLKFDDNPHYQKSKHAKACSFTICHYAGKVTYDARRWLEKNRDTLPPGSMQMMQHSKNNLLSQIFKATISRTGTLAMQNRTSKQKKISSRKKMANYARVAKARKLTVGHQFKNSLTVLMERMTSSQPVFVRCIKPNYSKQPGVFDQEYVNNQLLYTGMLETTKIRREGFAIRPGFKQFVDKYRILMRQPSLKADAEGCIKILQNCKLEGWFIGKTKVFLKHHHVDRLVEEMETLGRSVVHMQRVVRGFLGRRKFRYRKNEARLQAERVQILMDHIHQMSLSVSQMHDYVLEQDKAIPQEFSNKLKGVVKQPASEPYEDVNQIRQPTPPLYMTLEEPTEQDISEDDIDEDDESEGEILEDDFKPVKTTGAFGNEGTKGASVRWFKETQSKKLQTPEGTFAEWFHGIITRREAERLLQHKPVGCFLVRVSESRFGYSLSFRAEERCRHYMIDQTAGGKYVILGEPKVHPTLAAMVEYHQKHMLSNWFGLFTQPCGQEAGHCDYAELVLEDGATYDIPDTRHVQESTYLDPIKEDQSAEDKNISGRSQGKKASTTPTTSKPAPTRRPRKCDKPC